MNKTLPNFIVIGLLFIVSYPGYTQDVSLNSVFFWEFDSSRENYSEKQAQQVIRQKLNLTMHDELRLTKTETDPNGNRHQRFQHYYKGIKVEYGVVHVHFRNGIIKSINGEYYPTQGIPSIATITEAQSLAFAKKEIGALKYKWESLEEEKSIKKHENNEEATWFPKGEMVVAKGRLAWKLDIYALDPVSRELIYIDALDGKTLLKNSIINHTNSLGTADTRHSGTQTITTDQIAPNQYRLRDYTRGEGVITYDLNHSKIDANAVDLIDNDNVWTSAEYTPDHLHDALDAHWAGEVDFDYWWDIHNRKSYDNDEDNNGLGAPIILYTRYGLGQTTAFWDGSSLHFGDGGANFFGKTSLDAVSHELGHGIDDKTSNLTNSGESGALDEGMSDLWAACIENYANKKFGLSKDKWLFEEEIANPQFYNGALRSLINPKNVGDPDTYKGTNWLYNQNFDKGGIHHNCGVLGHWFYILSEGEQGTNDFGFNYNVTGVTIEEAEKILYQAQTIYMTSNMNFLNMRQYTVMAAEDLYGVNSAFAIAVKDAWDAVGVYEIPIGSCIPVVSSPNAAWIQRVSLGTLYFGGNGGISLNGYEDFSASEGDIAYVVKGTSAPIEIKTTNANNYIKVWIDFNNNSSFADAGEMVFSALSDANGLVNGAIPFPAAPAATALKMRVSMQWNSSLNGPCDPIDFGEVEDYAVVLIDPLFTSDGYCIPFGSQNINDWIETVTAGSIQKVEDNKKSTYYGYQDFFEQYTLDALPGSTVQFTMTGGSNNAGGNYYWKGWIDYDGNKIFEPSEVVFQLGPNSINDIVSSNVMIPAWLPMGTISRIRIGFSRDAFPTDPCAPVHYGEFEDYRLNISSPCTAPVNLLTLSASNNIADLKWDAVAPAQQYELAWSLTDGYNTLNFENSVSTQKQININTANPYVWKVRAQCLFNTSGWSDVQIVDPLNYCMPKSGDSNLRIGKVQVGNFTNLGSSISPFNGYYDLTKYNPNSQQGPYALSTQGGASVSLSLTSTSFSNNIIYWKIWIDYNKNGQFEQSEEVFSIQSQSNTTVNGSLVIPANASVIGTRMRVILSDNNPVASACASNFSGQTKDYLVDIIPICNAPTSISYSNVTATTANVMWTDPQGVGNYTLEYKLAGSVNWLSVPVNGQNSSTLTGLTPGAYHNVRVKRICGVSNESIWKDATTLVTVCPQPQNLQITNITGQGATVSWSDNLNVGNYTFEHRIAGANNWSFLSINGATSYTPTFMSPATTYEVSVRRSCPNATSTFINPAQTFTTDAYCVSKGFTFADDWIDLVQIETLTNVSDNSAGYFNYTGLNNPELRQGNTYTLNFSAAPSVHTRFWKAWIDFNHDGDLTDPGEEVLSLTSSSIGTVNSSISIPVNATLGFTRLRISTSGAQWPAPCTTFFNGEVEDYTINITDPNGAASARTTSLEANGKVEIEEGYKKGLYPNPVTDFLQITGVAAGDVIQIKNALGQEVFRGTMMKQIDVRSWSNGVYILLIQNANGVQGMKFIKE